EDDGLVELVDGGAELPAVAVRLSDEAEQRLDQAARQPGERRVVGDLVGRLVLELARVGLRARHAAVEEDRVLLLVLRLGRDVDAGSRELLELLRRALERDDAVSVPVVRLRREVAPAEVLDRMIAGGDRRAGREAGVGL